MARPRPSRAVPGDPMIVQVSPSRCASCGSTRRAPYHRVTRQHFAGNTREGEPYNVIVRRHTRCLDCGQARVDRSYEFDPGLRIQPWPPEPPVQPSEPAPAEPPLPAGEFRDPEPTP
jgi:hypothetical protein